MFVGKKNKDSLLRHLIYDNDIQKVIVFTQMKHMANRVVKKLEAAGIESSAIHGNKSQSARLKALDGFKKGRFKVLVATDVAARGIDVEDITHVINYDLPMEAETYVHRIGRTARAGANGDAISFCCAEDRAYLRAIESLRVFRSRGALRARARIAKGPKGGVSLDLVFREGQWWITGG